MKKVCFIIQDKDRLNEFKHIIEKIKSWDDYKDISLDFEIEYSTNFEEYSKIVGESLHHIITAHKDGLALAFLTPEIIFICNTFWNKNEKIKIAVIIHELGHIKYPLNISDDSFLGIMDDKGIKFSSLISEFLANKYTIEINIKLIDIIYEDWCLDNITKLNQLLEKPTNDYIWKLAQTYFVLKGFVKLMNSENPLIYIHKIENKFLDHTIPEDDIVSFNKNIELFLEDCNNKQRLSNLDNAFEKIEQ